MAIGRYGPTQRPSPPVPAAAAYRGMSTSWCGVQPGLDQLCGLGQLIHFPELFLSLSNEDALHRQPFTHCPMAMPGWPSWQLLTSAANPGKLPARDRGRKSLVEVKSEEEEEDKEEKEEGSAVSKLRPGREV
ncbi:hypothetical protein H8959_007279 [Pygathrix nigripes]